jgi:acyl-homoserine-lactone acylase
VLFIAAVVMGLSVVRGAPVAPTPAGLHPAPHGTIRRDTFGVPHILAETEQGAAFAHGYATAEDHLPDLARLFLRARGEQASVFGESSLRDDLLIQQLGIWDIAKERFGELPPYMQAVLDGYAEGYDAYLAEHASEAPPWAKPVTGIDVLAHCRAVLLLNFALDLRPWRDAKVDEHKGSNMWAIGRERSASARGLLLANPHLEWSGAHLFHEVQLTVPGKINVSGATLIGFPVITIGFNDDLGWTHTVNQLRADYVYELTLSPSDPTTYLYDGLELPIRARTVAVRVKTATGEETRTYTLRTSHFGPIIRVENGKAYAYRSANLGLVNFLTEYNVMAKAHTLAEFMTAVNMQQLPVFNIGYADRAGNILYLFNGRIPVRTRAMENGGILPGDSSDAEWQVVHPVAELPQLLNPPGGYIQNTNNAPWYTTSRPSLNRARFPAYIGGDGIPMRGEIGLQLLDATPKITLERLMAMRGNEVLGVASRVKADLIKLVKARADTSGDAIEAVQVLSAWDDRASVDSRGAVLFERWWDAYRTKASPLFKQAWAPAHPTTTPSGIGDPKAALLALDRVAAETKKQNGSLAVPWGDLHRVKRGDLDLPVGGNGDTFRTVWYKSEGGRQVAVGGDSYMLAVEFTSAPMAYSVLAYSQSSNRASPHFNDQLTLFAQKQYKRSWFSEADIQQHLERTYQPGRVAPVLSPQ